MKKRLLFTAEYLYFHSAVQTAEDGRQKRHFAICKIREDVSKYVQSSRILSLRIYVEKGWFPFGYQFQEKVKRNLRNLQITDAFESDRDVIIYFAILILDRINIKRKRLGDDTGIIN